jgi:hypothetical protein
MQGNLFMQFIRKMYLFGLLLAGVSCFTNAFFNNFFSVQNLELTVENIGQYPQYKNHFIALAEKYLNELSAECSSDWDGEHDDDCDCGSGYDDCDCERRECLFDSICELFERYPSESKVLMPLILQNIRIIDNDQINSIITRFPEQKAVFFGEILKISEIPVLRNYFHYFPSLVVFAVENPEHLSLQVLHFMYYDIVTDPQERKKLRTWAKKKYGTQDIDLNKVINDDKPFELEKLPFLYTCPKNSAKTQTEKHFAKNIARIVKLMNTYLHRFKAPAVKKMLWHAFTKESSEAQQNRYIFFHGRQWTWDFISDIYKRLYNLTAKIQMPADYIPLRFGDSEGDSLCMNYALFGNASDESSSTVSYVLRNHDYSNGQAAAYSTDKLFTQFGLYELYTKYQSQLIEIEKLHTEANPENYGSLLLLSVADQDIHRVFPADRGTMGKGICAVEIDGVLTSDTKKIIQALRTKPSFIKKGESDRIEFGMLLTRDYALDAQKGLRIFKFHAADQEKYQKYCKKCDALFAQISVDVQRFAQA